MTIFLAILLPFIGVSAVMWLPYWYSMPKWERQQLVSYCGGWPGFLWALIRGGKAE